MTTLSQSSEADAGSAVLGPVDQASGGLLHQLPEGGIVASESPESGAGEAESPFGQSAVEGGTAAAASAVPSTASGNEAQVATTTSDSGLSGSEVGESENPFRAFRGGGWSGTGQICWLANRGGGTPAFLQNDIGFRVCRRI